MKNKISITGLITGCIVLFGIIRYRLYQIYLPTILILLAISTILILLAVYFVEKLESNVIGMLFISAFCVSMLGCIIEVGLLFGNSIVLVFENLIRYIILIRA